MRILLVNPSQAKVYGLRMMPAYHPLGLLSIGTVLQQDGHEVRLLDIDSEGLDEAGFSREFEAFDPGAVALTAVTPTANDAFRWAALAKRLRPGIAVAMGGVHATIAAEEVIANPAVDIVAIGEGEETARELFRELARPAPERRLAGVAGLLYRDGAELRRSGRREPVADLDSLPFPDRRLLRNPGAFLPPDATHLPVATIMTSRGCPGRCTFCCTGQVFPGRFRARSVASILAELAFLKAQGYREVHIADDTFSVVRSRVFELRDALCAADLGLAFQLMNGVRARDVDREVLAALRDIGIKTVGFGVESGSAAVLERARKGVDLDTTRAAFRMAKELGFETWGFFIIGLPGETEETVRETVRLAKELDPDFAKFVILKPYPGSEVHRELARDGLLTSRDYDAYGIYTPPVHRLPGFPPGRMVYWQKRAFREFYLRPRKILAHLLRIRSPRQLRLILNDARFALHCMFKRVR